MRWKDAVSHPCVVVVLILIGMPGTIDDLSAWRAAVEAVDTVRLLSMLSVFCGISLLVYQVSKLRKDMDNTIRRLRGHEDFKKDAESLIERVRVLDQEAP